MKQLNFIDKIKKIKIDIRAITLIKPVIDPTERSILPVIITGVIPKANDYHIVPCHRDDSSNYHW